MKLTSCLSLAVLLGCSCTAVVVAADADAERKLLAVGDPCVNNADCPTGCGYKEEVLPKENGVKVCCSADGFYDSTIMGGRTCKKTNPDCGICSINNSCQSVLCELPFANSNGKVCCPQGQRQVVDGVWVCTQACGTPPVEPPPAPTPAPTSAPTPAPVPTPPTTPTNTPTKAPTTPTNTPTKAPTTPTTGALCTSNNDCDTTCALEFEDLNAPKVCCQYALANWITFSNGTSERVCRWSQVDGGYCSNNNLCASYRLDPDAKCVNNACTPSSLNPTPQQPTMAPVEVPTPAPQPPPPTAYTTCSGNNADCAFNSCGYEYADTNAPLVCCGPDGHRTSNGFKVCRHYSPHEALCEFDDVCISNECVEGKCVGPFLTDNSVCQKSTDCLNKACGHSKESSSSTKICCPSHKTLWSNQILAPVCMNTQNAGETCSKSGFCASGSCVAGTCGTNVQCTSHSQCPVDGACVEGTCWGGNLPTNSLCQNSAACENWSCAVASESIVQETCCPSGDSIYSQTLEAYVCTKSLSTGSICSRDEFCQSGKCVGGICTLPQKTQGSPCAYDDECQNGTCALSTETTGAGKVCCPSGSKAMSNIVQDYVCEGAQVLNSVCSGHWFCQSGLCINGSCKSQKQVVGGLCSLDSECANDACAYAAHDSTAQRICCPSGDYAYSPALNVYVCNGQAVDQPCSSDEVCITETCYEGKCASGLQQNLGPCDSHNDCSSKSCGLIQGANKCCPAGHVNVYPDLDVPRVECII